MTDNNHYENNENNENNENSSENSKAHHEARAGAFERFSNRKKRFRENAQKNGESSHHEAPLHHKKEHRPNKNQTTTTNPNMLKHEITPKKNWITTK